ncbi:hypothetical protein Bamb_5950 [Burkholderia ambifaria AMMD]|uniref:Uncharacterized protein n=1 Tax=Burkholderia ambifaria (strain ATCC BAA-244 / DSM 16087 / CCUG 44356 / LMG 19182 / AMMD) TaxID=339670 RepID=Q0B2X8_BURCM|nr:hypothetical protein Bamb_5950 [Burkholderia ambifaria AMMD]
MKLHPSFIHRIKARIQADLEGGGRWVADTLNRAVSTLALREIILVRRSSFERPSCPPFLLAIDLPLCVVRSRAPSTVRLLGGETPGDALPEAYNSVGQNHSRMPARYRRWVTVSGVSGGCSTWTEDPKVGDGINGERTSFQLIPLLSSLHPLRVLKLCSVCCIVKRRISKVVGILAKGCLSLTPIAGTLVSKRDMFEAHVKDRCRTAFAR